MKKDIYIVVGRYNHKSESYSPVLKELVDNLRELGEVNVFDMPHAEFGDSIEREDNLFVHHYACPNGQITNAALRKEDMIRDIVHIGTKACFVDYDVDAAYQPLIKAIHSAMRTYGIKTYTLNKRVPFRHLRNLWWNIRFWIDEQKRTEHEDDEISQAEGYSGHGTMDGFRLFKVYEKQYKARKQILEILKKL